MKSATKFNLIWKDQDIIAVSKIVAAYLAILDLWAVHAVREEDPAKLCDAVCVGRVVMLVVGQSAKEIELNLKRIIGRSSSYHDINDSRVTQLDKRCR